MKQTLNLKITQQLTLSPQLQQAIRLLQLSTLELNEEIERALEDNPLLEKEPEEGEAGSVERVTDAAADHDDIRNDNAAESLASEASENNTADEDTPATDTLTEFDNGEALASEDFVLTSDEGGLANADEEFEFQHAASVSLREHLLSQLALTPTTISQRAIVMALIDELDDNGYLTTDYPAFRDSLADTGVLSEKAFDEALQLLQSLDPVGVGARHPAECLALQLLAQPASAAQQAALAIVNGHLPLLAQRDFAALKKTLGIRDELLREAHALIRTLNPKPGAAFSTDQVNHIVPDVVVRKQNHRWVAFLNEAAIPKIRVNAMYAELLSTKSPATPQAVPPALSNRLQEARWLVRNIQQRFDTILRVSRAIVERQQRFFDHGPVAMRPMVLKDIADLLSLHESTVSRVTTQKYMLTPQGALELKYFFGSHVATSAGGACSSTAIRALIKKMVEEEPTTAPLSDQKITELLGKEGIMVARRTVAKYREALAIPPAHQRKDL